MEEEVVDKPTYIVYKYDGISIGLIAIKNSEGKVIVIVNTCEMCGEDSKGYFLYKDNALQNQSCGNKIAIDDLENLSGSGCDPITIKERKDLDGKIIIGTNQLKDLKDRFKKWNGPKI